MPIKRYELTKESDACEPMDPVRIMCEMADIITVLREKAGAVDERLEKDIRDIIDQSEEWVCRKL